MIVETGRVLKSEHGTATIEFERKAACGNCTARERCGMTESAAMLMEVVDPLGVQAGQAVQITLSENSALQASTIIYGIPLLAVVSGGLIGDWLGQASGSRDLWAMGGAFACCGLSLLLVRVFNNRFKRDRRNQPVITAIIG